MLPHRQLQIVHTYNDLQTTVDRYVNKLKEAGAERLGSGLFAKTYSNPNDPKLVIKVGCNIGQFNGGALPSAGIMDNDGYLTWVRQCLKYPTRHVPRILKAAAYVNDYKASTGVAYVVIMERLESALLKNHINDHEVMANAISPVLKGEVKMLASKHRQVAKSANPHASMLAKALADTWTVARKDLHNGNWMVRVQGKTKVAVITDPAT